VLGACWRTLDLTLDHRRQASGILGRVKDAVAHGDSVYGFPVPPATMDGFFYLRDEMHWFDPSGELRATCTPENGFPVPPR